MDFGLGLVLSFTDNATAGINNAVNSLNNLTNVAENASNSLNQMASLSALSVVSNQIGSSFTSMGQTIISTFSQIINKVNEAGTTMMYADSQLSKLYENSGKTGKEVLSDIQNYAKQSIFSFEDLIPAVIMLKGNGIEAFESIASSTGKSNQMLMDYAADLAAFNPEMRNMYGTGIRAAMGAINEYVAEGNARSLKQGASLDILGILGEEKGATIADRSRQVADLMEKLNMVGMTAKMAGTPMQQLSNMSDVLFQFINKISESGVYDKYTELVSKLSTYVFSIPEEELNNLAKIIGDALTTIMKPIEWVIDKLLSFADVIRGLVEVNPSLIKFATIGAVITGVLLLLVGIALKATSALSGLSLMLLASGQSFKTMGAFFKTGALKVLGVLLPLIATIGLLALAWKSDFLGIKTNVTNFVSNVTSSFKTARQAVDGSASLMMQTIANLDKDDFFDNLTLGVMKVMTLFKALGEAWDDNTISEDTFLKINYLGIRPLVENILDLKYRFGLFKDGFIEGWTSIKNSVVEEINSISKSVKGTAFEGIFNALTDFFEMLSNNDASSWKELGKIVGQLTPILVLATFVMKGVGFFVGIIEKIFGVLEIIGGAVGFIIKGIKTVIDVVSGVWGFISPLLSTIGGLVLKILPAAFANLPATLVGLLTIALIAVVGLIIKYRDQIFEKLKVIGSWIYDNVLTPVGNSISNFFKSLWGNIEYGFGVVADTVTGVFKSAVNTVFGFVGGVVNGVISGINKAIGLINNIPGVEIPKIPSLNIPKLALGGVVESPTTALIGEAGAEAVVPLENNTGWLSKLASMISDEMHSITPTNTRGFSTSSSDNNGGYISTNNNTSSTVYGDTDNSVVFSKGAIQLIVQNATEAEAMRLAKMVMEYIKRQKELDRMVRYAT